MVFITMLIEADGQDSTKYKVFGPVSCANESGEAVQPVGTWHPWHPTGKSSGPRAARPQTREMLNERNAERVSRDGYVTLWNSSFVSPFVFACPGS